MRKIKAQSDLLIWKINHNSELLLKIAVPKVFSGSNQSGVCFIDCEHLMEEYIVVC